MQVTKKGEKLHSPKHAFKFHNHGPGRRSKITFTDMDLIQLGIIGVIRTNDSKMRDFRSIRSNNSKHTIAIDLTIKTKNPNKT